MSRIELRHDGRRILVPIKILRPQTTDFTAVDVVALLDTGATASGITADLAGQLKLLPMGKRPMGSARGVDQVERYLFRIGLESSRMNEQPTFPFEFAPILGFEIIRGSSFDALLGMDVLQQCDVRRGRDGSVSLSFG